MELNSLTAISPIDGRYRNITSEISEYFSEYCLIKNRVLVEIKWLIKLFNTNLLNSSLILTLDDISFLENIINNFNIQDALDIKEIEKTTKHDVKAVEYYLREKFKNTCLEKFSSFIHFGCTSEDISNLAYGLMIKNTLNNIWLKSAGELINIVEQKSKEYLSIPMLSHTHGQPASTTTIGKELKVFVYRWNNILDYINSVKITGKFSGAVGNFNAHIVAYPNVDWQKLSKEFVESLGLIYNPITTQIESHDNICNLFNLITSFNNILMDFNSDMWLYISKNYFTQDTIKGEVGSSVMPHKVNPINHENSMSNIRISNAIFKSLSESLPVCRMQRDLSDSSSLRNIGVGFAHSLISIKQSIIGFNKMIINNKVLEQDLNSNPEILSEAIQTVLRKNNFINAYEILKEMTRGKIVTLEEIRKFIISLDIPDFDKNNLLNLTPSNYIGLCEKL